MQFYTTINGCPCYCSVLYYRPAEPMRITGSGFGDADPPEPEEFDFELLDACGKRLTWLEEQVTPEQERQLIAEYLACCKDI